MFHALFCGKSPINLQKLGAFVILVNFVAVNMVALCLNLNKIFCPEYLWEGIVDTYKFVVGVELLPWILYLLEALVTAPFPSDIIAPL